MIRKSISTKRTRTSARPTKDALAILDRIAGDDPELKEIIAQETINAQIARMILEARTQAGLSQKQLAELIGSKQPVIARLENADYEGHSLTMLQRIAVALNKQLEVRWTARDLVASR